MEAFKLFIRQMLLTIWYNCFSIKGLVWGVIILSLIFCGLLIFYKIRKNKYYHDRSRRKKPYHVLMQVLMFGCGLLAFLWVCIWCAINHKPNDMLTWLAGAGVLLTWIFQDTFKNVVAFVSLMMNKTLHLGDWIIVDKYGIDGEVKDISLTSVIVKNWDNTISSISTHSLLDTQLRNLENVVSNKALGGRRIMRSFWVNVHSVRSLTSSELLSLKQNLRDINEEKFVSVIDAAEEEGLLLNTYLFRRYLENWLLDDENKCVPISREPKFAVRFLELTPNGLPLQVYAFTSAVSWSEYEKVQTLITEHVVGTVGLFNLKLFQNPAGADTNKIYLTKE